MNPTPQPTSTRLKPKIWLALILLSFVGQFAWGVENQNFNIFMFDNIIPNPHPNRDRNEQLSDLRL